jgi:hypothetical protein
MSIPPRRLTNDDLIARAGRRAELTPGYPRQISEQDCADAAPEVVDAWLEAGRLTHLGLSPRRPR